ncbi:MAG: hypothetical protein M3Y91_11020 [Actinomycetota bacterium]|nr:hypothetical protein [Actinomycetota bacterium]
MTDASWEAGPARAAPYSPAPPVAASPEDRPLAPDPGWAALRQAVWESGPPQPSPWPEGPAWDPAGALTVPVTAVSGDKTAAHKVVPRPTAAHRISAVRTPEDAGLRPSQKTYRIGIARRIRSGFALILISVVVAGVLAAVLAAIVAGIASAISHAATS